MSFKEILFEAGFSECEAEKLASNGYFTERNKRRNAKEIINMMHSAALTYGVQEAEIRKIVTGFPRFSGYNHQRVLKDVKEVYNCTGEQASRAILTQPQFAGYDHQRVLKEVKEAYGWTEEQASKTVLSHPQFAGLDNQRVLKVIKKVYGWTDEQASKAMSTHPNFANYDHQRVLKGVKEVYGWTDEQASKAILAFPQFAGYDHQRVLRQLDRLGRVLDFGADKIKSEILGTPRFASFSAKRYLAAIDVGRYLDTDGLSNDAMFQAWKSYASKSPYVPGTKRLSITKALRQNNYETEPPLMELMRKRVQNAVKQKIA